jgi:hypothetical protein
MSDEAGESHAIIIINSMGIIQVSVTELHMSA